MELKIGKLQLPPEPAPSFLELFTNFLITNWFSIFTWIAGIALAIFLYFLQNKRANSAYLEQIKQAKKEIIDTLENYIINDVSVSSKMIENLRAGTERSYNIKLDSEWDSISLLQDINFRLQTSRHLAISKKQKYSETLDGIIDSFKNEYKNQNENKSLSSIDSLVNFQQIINSLSEEQKNEAKKEIIDFIKFQQNIKSNQFYQSRTRKIDMIIKSITIASFITFIFSILIKFTNLNDITFETVQSVYITSFKNMILLFLILLIFIGIKLIIYKIPKKNNKQ